MFRRLLRRHQGELFIASAMNSEEIKKKVKKKFHYQRKVYSCYDIPCYQ
jgi:hypothetical protein